MMRELRALRAEADRMIEVYAEASVVNDLTFIKMIEDKYRELSDEIAHLSEKVAREQEVVFPRDGNGGIGQGEASGGPHRILKESVHA